MVGMFSITLLGLAWTQWGHDPQNTFRAEGVGELGEKPAVKWTADAYGYAEQLLVADLDGDGSPEVVDLIGYGNVVGVFNGSTGELLWSFERPEDDSGLVSFRHLALGDVNGDGKLEIIFTTQYDSDHPEWGHVYCLSSQGVLLWRDTTKLHPSGGEEWYLLVEDVNGDGASEIFYEYHYYDTSDHYGVAAIDGEGRLLWQREGAGFPRILADFDGDGEKELLTFSSSAARLLEPSSGALLDLDYVSLGNSLRLLNADDLDGDGAAEVVGFTRDLSDARVVVHKYTGGEWQLLWEYSGLDGFIEGGILADVNGDGCVDVIAFDTLDNLVAIDGPSGSLLWAVPAQSSLVHLGRSAIADIDGDGKLEILYGVDKLAGATIYAHDLDDGSLLWSTDPFDDFWSSGPPCVITADVDGDEKLEVVIHTGEDGSMVVTYDTRGSETEESFGGQPNIIVRGLRNALLATLQERKSINIYSKDGRLVKALKLQPGRTVIPLKPGVYLWRAGKYSGKAVVKP